MGQMELHKMNNNCTIIAQCDFGNKAESLTHISVGQRPTCEMRHGFKAVSLAHFFGEGLC